jgi:FkbM family methyltransferase
MKVKRVGIRRRSRIGAPRLRKARKFLRLARDPLFRRGLSHRVAAAVEHESVALARNYATIIDVGAHTGQFALFAWRRYPGSKLYCFEPLPRARDTLRKVLSEHPNLEIFASAAGAASERRQFHVAGRDDSSSLLGITGRCSDAFPGTEEIKTIPVECQRLDETLDRSDLRRPCLLKIDVQGSELEVIEGGEGLLESVDDLLVELSYVELYEQQPLASDVITHLGARGFNLTGVFGQTRDRAGACLQADFLFSSHKGSHIT